MLPAYRYRAELVRVIDADTLYLRVDLGFHAALTISVRLRGVDAPELSTPEGKVARDYVIRLLSREVPFPAPIIVETYKDQQSFALWIGDVWIGDTLVADLLRVNGYVK